MSVKASHRISVLGKEITVKSSATAEHVHEVEALVNRKLVEAQAAMPVVGDPQVPIILALMNLAESYLLLSRELEEKGQADKEIASRLLKRIDSALP